MSLKPKKKSDAKKIKAKMKARESRMGTKEYLPLLYTYFAYSKTREDLYDILMKKGSLVDAKRRAKRLYQEFLDAQISNPSAMVPATRMFELVEELERYL